MESAFSELKEWHANYVQIGRKKYLLFLNSKSLFFFYTRSIRKSDFKNLEKIFKEELAQIVTTLVSNNPETIEKLVKTDENVVCRKKPNRSKLGYLNDNYQILKHFYNTGEDIEKNKIDFINRLNKMPMKRLDWGYSSTALKEELGLIQKK